MCHLLFNADKDIDRRGLWIMKMIHNLSVNTALNFF